MHGGKVVGDGTDVGYGAGSDGVGGVSGGGRRCIVAVQGVQGWWLKELWYEELYTQIWKKRSKQERRENKKRMKKNDENRTKEEKDMKVKIRYSTCRSREERRD